MMTSLPMTVSPPGVGLPSSPAPGSCQVIRNGNWDTVSTGCWPPSMMMAVSDGEQYLPTVNRVVSWS
jgi:hypothetical protein